MMKQPWEEDNEDAHHHQQQHELELCIHDAVGMHILEEVVVAAAADRYAFDVMGPTLHHMEEVNADNNEEEKVVLLWDDHDDMAGRIGWMMPMMIRFVQVKLWQQLLLAACLAFP